MADGAGDSDDDGGAAAENADAAGVGGAAAATSLAAAALSGAGQGKHTRDILAANNTGSANKPDAAAGDPTRADGEGGGIRLGRLKRATGTGAGGAGSRAGAGLTPAELDALRDAIQRLCSSTTPLGKSMDYIAEDVEDMRAELRAWRGEYKRRADALDKELRDTDEALAPYKKALADVDERCREKQRNITAVKASVAQNDARIQELVRMAVLK
jgi:TRAF3-interacting protein 1